MLACPWVGQLLSSGLQSTATLSALPTLAQIAAKVRFGLEILDVWTNIAWHGTLIGFRKSAKSSQSCATFHTSCERSQDFDLFVKI